MTGLTLDQLVSQSADPEGAAPRLARFLENGGQAPLEAEARRLLVALCASGSYLPGILAAHPDWFLQLAHDPFVAAAKPRGQLRKELAEALSQGSVGEDAARFARTLRRFARREMLRLGARELGWGQTLTVARELSGLADVCIEAAVTFHEQRLREAHGAPTSPEGPPGFVVLALGKLGGEELNFSSDVDLCYFYTTDEGHAGTLSLHEYYVKLSHAVTRAIAEITEDGFVFRVDLRLRPEGRSGPVCNSVWAAERYYETFGRTWERQALLRSRPCGGDLALGQRLIDMLQPFVFPRSLDAGAVDEVRALRRLFRVQGERGPFNVKLGVGGIRDVELVAQVLVLLHGGKRPDLRERNTLAALRKLWVAGLISDREQQTLADAYRWFRQIEHRLQLEHGQQTHELPADEAGQARLARRLGFSDREAFLQALEPQREAVATIAATLGEPQQAPPALVLRLLDPGRAPEDFERDLQEAGFPDMDAARGALEHVRGRLPAAWLTEALRAPDPSRALLRFRDLVTGGSPGLFSLLRDHPQLLRMLANLFGTSDRLSRYLVSQPARWEPLLIDMGAPRPPVHLWSQQLAERLEGLEEEEALREMRRFKTEHLIRLGLHDVAGTLAPEEVSAQLVAVAEACLLSCVRRVVAAMTHRWGLPDAELTILGLGSLGAGQMRYGSDLDLVFLYSRDGCTAKGMDHREWFARLTQRLISAMGAWMDEGKLYDVDVRLRPSGAQGLLVSSYQAFHEYHEEAAAPWERSALLRARPLISLHLPSDTTNDAFVPRLRQVAYGTRLQADEVRANLHHMRERIVQERAPDPRVALHMRLSPGGLTDCEFIASYGQLLFGPDVLQLQTPDPQRALEVLVGQRRLPIGRALLEDQKFLARLALRMRLLRDTADERLFPRDEAFLARTLGVPEAELSADLRDRMQRVRCAFDAVLG